MFTHETECVCKECTRNSRGYVFSASSECAKFIEANMGYCRHQFRAIDIKKRHLEIEEGHFPGRVHMEAFLQSQTDVFITHIAPLLDFNTIIELSRASKSVRQSILTAIARDSHGDKHNKTREKTIECKLRTSNLGDGRMVLPMDDLRGLIKYSKSPAFHFKATVSKYIPLRFAGPFQHIQWDALEIEGFPSDVAYGNLRYLQLNLTTSIFTSLPHHVWECTLSELHISQQHLLQIAKATQKKLSLYKCTMDSFDVFDARHQHKFTCLEVSCPMGWEEATVEEEAADLSYLKKFAFVGHCEPLRGFRQRADQTIGTSRSMTTPRTVARLRNSNIAFVPVMLENDTHDCVEITVVGNDDDDDTPPDIYTDSDVESDDETDQPAFNGERMAIIETTNVIENNVFLSNILNQQHQQQHHQQQQHQQPHVMIAQARLNGCNIEELVGPSNQDGGDVRGIPKRNVLSALPKMSDACDFSISMCKVADNKDKILAHLSSVPGFIEVGLHTFASTIPLMEETMQFPEFDLRLIRNKRAVATNRIFFATVNTLHTVQATRVFYDGRVLLFPLLNYHRTQYLFLKRVTAPDFGMRPNVFPRLEHLVLHNAQVNYAAITPGNFPLLKSLQVDCFPYEADEFGLKHNYDHYGMNDNFALIGFQHLALLYLFRCCVSVAYLPALKDFAVLGGRHVRIGDGVPVYPRLLSLGEFTYDWDGFIVAKSDD